MTLDEIAVVEATIARVRAKLRAATDEKSRFYYRQCLIGWLNYLAKLKTRDSSF